MAKIVISLPKEDKHIHLRKSSFEKLRRDSQAGTPQSLNSPAKPSHFSPKYSFPKDNKTAKQNSNKNLQRVVTPMEDPTGTRRQSQMFAKEFVETRQENSLRIKLQKSMPTRFLEDTNYILPDLIKTVRLEIAYLLKKMDMCIDNYDKIEQNLTIELKYPEFNMQKLRIPLYLMLYEKCLLVFLHQKDKLPEKLNPEEKINLANLPKELIQKSSSSSRSIHTDSSSDSDDDRQVDFDINQRKMRNIRCKSSLHQNGTKDGKFGILTKFFVIIL